MSTVDTKELILEFEKMFNKACMFRDSHEIKVSLSCSFWDGYSQGIQDCMEYIATKEPVIMKMTGGSK